MQSAEKKKSVLETPNVALLAFFVAETMFVKTATIEGVVITQIVHQTSVVMETFAILAAEVTDNVVVFPLVVLEAVVTV